MFEELNEVIYVRGVKVLRYIPLLLQLVFTRVRGGDSDTMQWTNLLPTVKY